MITKQCRRCNEVKNITEFHKLTQTKDGIHYYCKLCKCLYEKEQRIRNPNLKKASHLRKYGLTLEQFNEIMIKQKGCCAICKKPEKGLTNLRDKTKSLSVDHCHSTGRVRGLLCSNCNRGIGHLKEDITLMRVAMRYLKHG